MHHGKPPAGRSRTLAALVAALAVFPVAGPAAALDLAKDEESKLKSCEKRLCGMILTRNAEGIDLSCALTKTWAKSTLDGGESKGMSWGFGDARCSVDVKLRGTDLVAALTNEKHTVRLEPHTVKCIVERNGEVKPVELTLAPKLKFKNGEVDKVWVELKDIKGPGDIESTVWAAAKLEDSLGIFHRPLIKSINKFMHKQCAKRYGAEANAKRDPEPKAASTTP